MLKTSVPVGDAGKRLQEQGRTEKQAMQHRPCKHAEQRVKAGHLAEFEAQQLHQLGLHKLVDYGQPDGLLPCLIPLCSEVTCWRF